MERLGIYVGLKLAGSGFEYSVLSEFRGRLPKGEKEEGLLERLQEEKLVKGGGQHRTDSSPVLAAVRRVNCLELLKEMMRYILNKLAIAAPIGCRTTGQ